MSIYETLIWYIFFAETAWVIDEFNISIVFSGIRIFQIKYVQSFDHYEQYGHLEQ